MVLSVEKTSSGREYKVKDLSQADFGRLEIELAEVEMPVLMACRTEFGPSKPFAGAGQQEPRPEGGPAADQRDNAPSPPSPSASSRSGPRRLLLSLDENAAGPDGGNRRREFLLNVPSSERATKGSIRLRSDAAGGGTRKTEGASHGAQPEGNRGSSPAGGKPGKVKLKIRNVLLMYLTMPPWHHHRIARSSSVAGFPRLLMSMETSVVASGFKIHKQEQNPMCNVPIPTFTVRNQMTVTTTQGAQIPQKMPSWVNENKSECPVSCPPDVQNQANSGANGVGVKPQGRARRGQATDPHSIAERLRREKISDRMKKLQDLVPNSNKADKASVLDEIIDYVKFLQLQVKVLSMSRLGAPGTVLPLLAESQTEGCHGQPLSAATNAQGLLDTQDSEDALAFEEEVVKLMETSITSAMQYLQNKGLCLMSVALASAIST